MEKDNLKPAEMDDILIQYVIGSATDAEIRAVQNWLKESNENIKYFDQLRDLYFLGKLTKTPSGYSREQSLERIRSKYYQTRYHELQKDNSISFKRKSYGIAVSIAATFIVAMAMGFYLNYLFSASTNGTQTVALYNEVTAPKGSRSIVTLPDGTKVWLNAGSKLTYPMDFMKDNRTVTLIGEAFFEVTKIKDKRFIVRTSDLAIKVWGTKFNVKAYPDDKTIQTTLVEGSVSIANIKSAIQEKETYLTPKQTAVFYKKETANNRIEADNKTVKPIEVTNFRVLKKVNTVLYTSWKDEKWIIEGQTLGSLAKELERRYNVEISFETEAIKNYKFNGIFTNETFEQLLTIIKLSAPIDFRMNNNHVLLKENSSSKMLYDKFLKH